MNAHLDKLEAFSKSQLQLVKIEGARSDVMAKEIEALSQRLKIEEEERLSLIQSVQELSISTYIIPLMIYDLEMILIDSAKSLKRP